MRKTSVGRLLSLVCLLLSLGHYLQSQTGAQTPSPTQREIKLNRAVSERYGKIAKVLQPEARKKLAIASLALLKEMEKSSELADPEKAARAQVEKQFRGLSEAQLVVLSFYVLANVARFEEEASENRDKRADLEAPPQLRTQMYMDQMTKAERAASNLMKKFSETMVHTVGNLN